MGGGGFLVITVSHPTFCCVGVGLWLRLGWAVTIQSFTSDICHVSTFIDLFCCLSVWWFLDLLEHQACI